ncbi:NUDIX domain-containing protein [Agromyces intestinalis]|uniref:NUDIX domain-containing protein n=1 Tax=Agromyces intestinalis TaxID=2592652 RepID=A0A5C1YLW9_9MICO|nr:NUDIX domain-containing protein [Agromyces intestinalis]QEO16199.1 NUDIX domain-containing protein [Agromyces intestinalis]
MPTDSRDERESYSDAYAARHGGFALIPAAHVFLTRPADGDGSEPGAELVLLQRRVATDYYDGWWAASAAGHVELGETAYDAAVRETAEELGVEVGRLRPLTTVHRVGPGPDDRPSDRPTEQRVDFYFQAVEWAGEPRPNDGTADLLQWFPLDALPERTVHHERHVLELFAAGSLPIITDFGWPTR